MFLRSGAIPQAIATEEEAASACQREDTGEGCQLRRHFCSQVMLHIPWHPCWCGRGPFLVIHYCRSIPCTSFRFRMDTSHLLAQQALHRRTVALSGSNGRGAGGVEAAIATMGHMRKHPVHGPGAFCRSIWWRDAATARTSGLLSGEAYDGAIPSSFHVFGQIYWNEHF